MIYNNVDIFSVATENYLQILKLITLGLKKYKSDNVNYTYHIMFQTDNLNKYQNIFKEYETNNFKIKLLKTDIIVNKIQLPFKNKLTFIRCVLPSLFPSLEKILYLDVDLLIAKQGLEDLFNENIDNYYCAAVEDYPQQYVATNEPINAKVKKYFNAGVILFNLKKIREDGLDKVLEHDLIQYPKGILPIQFDQTLLNYRFKENVKFVSPIYNNIALGVNYDCVQAYKRQYKKLGWESVPDSAKDTVIFHYAGMFKPWKGLFNIPWGKQNMQSFIDVVTDLGFKIIYKGDNK